MEQMGQKKKTTFFRLHCLGLGTDLKQRQRLEGDLLSISDLQYRHTHTHTSALMGLKGIWVSESPNKEKKSCYGKGLEKSDRSL